MRLSVETRLSGACPRVLSRGPSIVARRLTAFRVKATKDTDLSLETAVEVPDAAPARQTGQEKKPSKGPPPPAPIGSWPPQRSFLDVVGGKVLDTVNDVSLITRRTLFPVLTSVESSQFREGGPVRLAATSRPVVLVLGSGWGAHAFMKVITKSKKIRLSCSRCLRGEASRVKGASTVRNIDP